MHVHRRGCIQRFEQAQYLERRVWEDYETCAYKIVWFLESYMENLDCYEN